MIQVPSSARVWIATGHTDLRTSTEAVGSG